MSKVASIPELERAIASQLATIRSEHKADAVTFHYYDEENNRLILPVGVGLLDEDRFKSWLPSMNRVAGKVIVSGEPVIAEHAEDNRGTAGPFGYAEQIKSTAGFPLITDVGRKLGVLFINYRQPHQFPAEKVAGLRESAAEVAKAIENWLAQTPKLKAELAVHPGLPRLELALQEIAQGIAQVLEEVAVAIWVPERGGQSLVVKAHAGPTGKFVRGVGLDLQQSNPVTAAFNSRPPAPVTARIREEPALRRMADGARWRELWAFPVLSASRAAGVLGVWTIGHTGMTEHEKAVVHAFLELTARTLENERTTLTLHVLQAVGSRFTRLLEDRLKLMEEIAKSAAQVMGADNVSLLQYDADKQDFCNVKTHAVTYRAPEELQQPRKHGASMYVRDHGYVIIEDMDKLDEKKRRMAWTKHILATGSKAYLGIRIIANEITANEITPNEITVGVLFLNYLQPRQFSPDEIGVAEIFADYAANAIYGARLLEGMRERTKDLSALNTVGQALTSGIRLKQDEILQLIYEQASRLMDANNMYIALYDETTDTVTFGLAVLNGKRVQVGQGAWAPRQAGKGATEAIILSKSPLFFRTAQEAREWYGRPENEEYVGKIPARYGYIGVPMLVGQRILGVIAVRNLKANNVYDEDDLAALATMASQAAIALDNANLYYDVKTQLERRVRALTALDKIGQALTSGIHLKQDEILNLIYEHGHSLTHAQNMYIALYDDESEIIRFVLVMERGQRIAVEQDAEWAPRQIDRQAIGKTEEVILSKKPILHRTQEESEQWYNVAGRKSFQRKIPPSWLGVPMALGDKVLGMIAVYDWDKEYQYDELDLEVLSSMASQAAIALDNAKLYYEVNLNLGKRVQELETVRKIIQGIAAETDLKTLLDTVAREARDIVKADSATANQYSQDVREFYSQTKLESEQQPLPRTGGTSEEVIQCGEIVFADDAPAHPIVGESNFVRARGVKSCMVAPLKVGNECVGVLYVNFFSASHHFTDDEKRVLRIIADQAAVAIHTIGGLHDAKRQLETVLQAISAAKEAPTLDQLLQTYLEFSLKEVEAESGTIQLLDPSAEALTIEARVGDVSNRKYESITVEQGITGRAVREQRLIYVPDVSSDPQYLGYFGNMQSEMAVPLVVNDVPLGVLNAEHSRQGAFDLYKRRLFELFASQAAVLINERIKLEEAHHQKLQTELDANAAQMTRHMTHRMKNYLGSARLSLRKVTDKASLSAEHRQELKEADSRMVRCAVIVAELFKPYRRARKIKVTVESLICGATDRLVKLPGTEISILLPDALPTVKVEVNAAIDYFYELLTNATRFAQARLKEGGISKGEIQITGRVQDEKWVEVLFTNNGPPIPKKRWQVIFQQFSGFPDEDENPEHFGLGLWGARTFFRRQGGTVRVLESAEDHTTFVVRLPAAE